MCRWKMAKESNKSGLKTKLSLIIIIITLKKCKPDKKLISTEKVN